ncbi:MAG TPA: nucleotide exchange factor GrpE [Candidatus Binatia bacterium]|nr:nucleotide exchange factor GrpE [Candidatus Binatia bacterium]
MSDEQMQDTPAEQQTENTELEDLKAKNEELLNNWKRTAADFENFKRRKETEIKELVDYSKEMAVMRLLPSLQSLEQVLNLAPNDEKYKDWLLGLKATIMQLEKTMEEMGVMKIKTVGEEFDPNLHEALQEVESETDGIVKELQPGFLLNGKVMIPAKVVVGKKK